MSSEQLLSWQWRVNLNTMSKKWAAALTNDIPGIGHDVKLLVGEDQKPISGHKLVLGVCSPVFQDLFSDRFKTDGEGATMTTIEVPDVNFNGMSNIFKYAYTGEMNINLKDALTTMYAANKYDIPEIVSYCSGLLRSNLSADNVVTIYQSALELYDSELMTKAEKYIVCNFHDILESEDFLRFTKYNLCEFLKSDVINAQSETAVFKGVVRWGARQCELLGKDKTQENLREALAEALYHVRMPSMTSEDFVSVIEPSNVFSLEEANKLCRYFLYRQLNRDTNLLLKELNLSTSERQIQMFDRIVNLYSDFTPKSERDASTFNRHFCSTSFQIDGNEMGPTIYLKGVGLVGSPSIPNETESISFKLKIGQNGSYQPRRSLLCDMEISFPFKVCKSEMIDLGESIKILPKRQYNVYTCLTLGRVAELRNPKKHIVLFNETDGLKNPIKMTVIDSESLIYSLKFSLSK